MGRIGAALRVTPLLAISLWSAEVRLLPEAPDRIIRFAPRWRAPGQKRIALSLRGGSAKGLAHIGVLQRFEEEGLPLDGITGTSAGAFVAALAASGFSGPNQARVFQSLDPASLLDDRRRSRGISLSEEEDRNAHFFSADFGGGQMDLLPGRERTQRVRWALFAVFGQSFLSFGEDFDHMRIPIRIVATDLQTGGPWVFRKGFLADAVQASMTIPGLLVPPVVEGHQLVDGGLVENLPIAISREAFPDMLQVGVDISRSWDTSRVNSVLSLLNRSLDTSMHQNELRSRQAADLLISPTTDQAADFDFHDQVSELMAAGRVAFDESLPRLEALVYGPEGERIVGRAPLELEETASPGVRRLVQASLPSEGPLRQRDLYRLLRRLLSQEPLQDAWVEVSEGPNPSLRLHTLSQPTVRRVELRLPKGLHTGEAWRYQERAAVPGLRPGDAFSPVALDACLAEFSLFGAMPECTYLRFSPTFDPVTGTLILRGEGIPLQSVEIASPELAHPIRNYLEGMEGRPIRPMDLMQHLEQARIRFGLTRFDRELSRTPEGIRMKVIPRRESSVTLSLAPAFETELGAHLGLGADLRNPFGIPTTAQFYGAIDSLQKRASLAVDREIHGLPGFGYGAFMDASHQAFGRDLQTVEGPKEGWQDLELRSQGWGFGLWGRFGGDVRGIARLSAEERRSSYTLGGIDSPRGLERTVQFSVEWDNLDYHLLPTEGSLLRLRGGRSFHVASGLESFEFAYARLRHLRRLPALPFSLELDLEGALGWNTPLARWNILGGSGSIIGTHSAAYLVPNAAFARIGFPFTSVSFFGVGVQAVPRVDWGRFSQEPSALSRGPRTLGLGMALRSIVRNFNVEVSFGQTQSRGGSEPGMRRNSEFTVLLGTRPFDLWKQR